MVESVEDGLRFVEHLNAARRGAPGIHARRRRWRFAFTRDEATRAAWRRPARRAPSARCWSSAACWAGTRSSSRCCATRRTRHRHLRHGEHGPDGGPHRRLDRGRSHPDAARSARPAAAPLRAEDRARAAPRGRLQRAAGGRPRRRRLPGDRGQPAGQPLVGARQQGDRLSDRPRRGADRARQAPARAAEPGDRPGAPPSSRRSTTWSSSCPAGRSTSSPAPIARWGSR